MSERTSLSVITCTYNAEPELLRAALVSVAEQTVVPDELVLVDDGSETPLVRPEGDFPFEVRLVRHEQNLGFPAALNTGVAEARCDLVSFLDADDRWLPTKTERQLQLWRERGDGLALLAARAHVLDADLGRVVEIRPRGGLTLLDFRKVLRKDWFTGWSTVMLPRERFLSVGGCDTALRRCQDWDFWLRATARSGQPVGLLEEALVVYRYEARSYGAAPVALEVFRRWRSAVQSGEAPAIAPRELARLAQHHLINFAYRAIAAGRGSEAVAALDECSQEPDGSLWLRCVASVARRAPRLFAASIAYRKMAQGRIGWRLRPRDPRWGK
jgi:glycosyltransferase involved in cell wall biosynthesis